MEPPIFDEFDLRAAAPPRTAKENERTQEIPIPTTVSPLRRARQSYR